VARKILKLVTEVLEHLNEGSKLKICIIILGLTKTLLVANNTSVWQGTPLKLSELELLKDVFVFGFKANNVCSIQDHSLDALKEYAECFLSVGFESSSALGDFLFKTYLNVNKE
jgi:hypothetical protein